MRRQLLSICLGILISLGISAQVPAQRICGSMTNLDRLKSEDPDLAARMQQIENQTAAYISQLQHGGVNTTNTVITIPVVFHIVYNTTAQNISDAQCQAQLAQLNLDFARLNTDASNTPAAFQGLAANTNVQFCMAQRDPAGNATTGIERRSTTSTSFSSNDNMKRNSTGGLDAWNSANYLNIWSVNFSGGLLGYAQFPGGPAATDGVVLLYSSIGSMARPGTASPYHLGRTATHEVGHWLNLYHIWGDDGTGCSGSDQVGDTPNQAGENYGCPAFPRTDGCNTTSPGVMFMNYMDYTNDACMNMFTAGQTTRMNAIFASGGSRVAMLSSLGCQAPTGGTTCNVPTGQSASGITTSGATLNWTAVSGAISYNLQYRINGSSGVWTSTTSTTNSKTISGLAASTAYEWQVQTVCSAGSSAFSGSSVFTTSAVASCGLSSGLSATGITSAGATLNWAAVSGAVSYNVQYRVNGSASAWTTTTSTTNSKAISGLATSTTYEFQVQTVCSAVSSAFTSSSIFTTSAVAASCGLPTTLSATSITSSGATLNWSAVSGVLSYNINYRVNGSGSSWTATTSTTNSKVISGLLASTTYEFQVQAVCSGASSSFTNSAVFTTSAVASGCSNSYESNNTYATAAQIAVATDINSLVSPSGDQDYYTFNNTSAQRYIKITLSNLPGDYDIRLYNPSGTYVAISQLGGTSSETIVYNTNTIGTYHVRVYGYNGANSASQCYLLRVLISSTTFRTIETNEEAVSLNSVANEFSIFPNPASSEVNLSYFSSKEEIINIRMFDMVGKTVMTNQKSVKEGANQLTFDLGLYNEGIYFFEVTNSSEKMVRKLILEK